jgi:type I restriction enzyme S subunit
VYRDRGVLPKASRDDNYNKTPEDVSQYKRVRSGDVVVNKMKAWSGSLAVSRYDGIVSGDYMVCELKADVDPDFLHYSLRSSPVLEQVAGRSSGIRPSQWRLYWDDFREVRLMLPDTSTQRRVGRWLRSELERLDAAAERRQASISLLDERLDALVRMRIPPVGADGTGTGRRIRDIAHLTNGFPFDSTSFKSDGPIPVVRIRDLLADEFETFIDGPVPNEVMVRNGDIVIGMDGDFNAVVWERGRAALNQRVCSLRLRSGHDPRYVAYAIAEPLRTINELTFATTVKHLSADSILRIRIPSTAIEEQLAVADEIDVARGATRSVATAIQQQTRLVNERRQALITAAVTGQMEIPGVAA